MTSINNKIRKYSSIDDVYNEEKSSSNSNKKIKLPNGNESKPIEKIAKNQSLLNEIGKHFSFAEASFLYKVISECHNNIKGNFNKQNSINTKNAYNFSLKMYIKKAEQYGYKSSAQIEEEEMNNIQSFFKKILKKEGHLEEGYYLKGSEMSNIQSFFKKILKEEDHLFEENIKSTIEESVDSIVKQANFYGYQGNEFQEAIVYIKKLYKDFQSLSLISKITYSEIFFYEKLDDTSENATLNEKSKLDETVAKIINHQDKNDEYYHLLNQLVTTSVCHATPTLLQFAFARGGIQTHIISPRSPISYSVETFNVKLEKGTLEEVQCCIEVIKLLINNFDMKDEENELEKYFIIKDGDEKLYLDTFIGYLKNWKYPELLADFIEVIKLYINKYPNVVKENRDNLLRSAKVSEHETVINAIQVAYDNIIYKNSN